MLKEKVQSLAQKHHPEVVNFRRHLHQHPELSFQEFNTCKFVKTQLESWGVKTQIMADTGVIGIIEGKNPTSKIIALRADMDALPIQERNEIPFKSQNEGVMHACGHDAHTSSLLGTARILQQLREDWQGTIKLIFQPGEEKLPGGASLLIKEGVLENPKPTEILGQHVEPLLDVGKAGIKGGLFMASADEIHVTVRGKGGHAAKPQNCIDPILITSQLIVQLQQIVSRNTDPLMPTVLSFGKIYSEGGATNIIPDEVKILGTLRTFDEAWRIKLHTILVDRAQLICKSMGGSCDFDISVGYPFLHNDLKLTEKTRKHMETYLGKENVVEMPARMGAEDFAFYSQKMPACFYRLGVQNPNGTGLHTPNFNIDEKSLEVGVGLMSWLAMQR
ncbi:MAG: M20 family metallopeptidase [Saprospiraceae bacterium]|nr:M20 family metallopeptidase [Saprospiraceae bacterium]